MQGILKTTACVCQVAGSYRNEGWLMAARACLLSLFLLMPQASPQAVSAINPAPAPGQMMIPPPLQINGYPREVGAEIRSNYLSGGMAFSTSYIDNFYAGSGTQPVSETTYSILPTITWDQTTPRRHVTLQYTPGFSFYQPSSQLNEIDQNGAVAYMVRPSPHSTVSISDNFAYSSTSFGAGVAGIGEPVSGSIDTVTPALLAPFAQRLTNDANGEFTLQTSEITMIGVSGNASTLRYPDIPETAGLYDSSSRGGAGFYSARIFGSQYLGGIYEFSQILSYLSSGEGETQIHTFAGLYTVYPMENLSLSFVSGAQHYWLTEPSMPDSASWGPTVSASAGWQALHTSFAASYSHGVTAGGGLLGAYHSNSGDAALRWQMSRSVVAGMSAAYTIQKNVNGRAAPGSEDGHAISGTANVSYRIGPRVALEFGYDRIHQSYDAIPATSINPDSNRVTAAISWRFTRPLGR